MDVSIIIVNWNTSQLLRQCIESIYRANPQISFEIIVVDNGSTDESVNMVRTLFPSVRLILNHGNLGFARANNQGLAAACGRYYLLLNTDTVVTQGALDALVTTADQYEDVGAIGPRLANMDGTLQESSARFPTIWSELSGRLIRDRVPVAGEPFAFDVDWVGGACILVRATTVAQIGGLDETFSFYSEEVDWCFRMKQMGWRVWYLSSAQVYHLGGGSAKPSATLLGLLYQNKLHYFRKHHGPVQAHLLRHGLIMVYSLGLIRHILRFPRKRAEGYLDRITVRTRLIWYLLQNKFPELNG